MPTTSEFVPPPRPVRPKLLASKFNERLKLAAAAFDRLSTVVIGGAILAPLFQDQAVDIKRLVFWAAAAFVLHGAAQSMLTLFEEEP